MMMASCLTHPPTAGDDGCWHEDVARLSTPGHQVLPIPITHRCLTHGSPQSPFVCDQQEPGQLEGPGLAVSLESAERGASHGDEAEARKNRSRRKKLPATKKLQSCGRGVSHWTITHATQRDFHYSLCCETKGLSLRLRTESFFNYLEMEISFESPMGAASVGNSHLPLRRA